MSPASVSNFVGDLVAMATAFEKLPQVEHDLAEARNTINNHLNTIQRLEAKLMERSNEITEHLARIRSLEVERDDAQFHVLEADDRTQRALDFIKATFGNAGALIQALEPPTPPKAEPTDTPVPVQAVSETSAEAMTLTSSWPHTADEGTGERAVDPITAPTPSSSSGSPSGDTAVSSAASPSTEPSPASEVASSGEPHTYADTQSGPATHDAGHAPAEVLASAEPDAPTVDPSQKLVGIYTGRRYSDVVKGGSWPTREQWEAGGGTIDNWYA